MPTILKHNIMEEDRGMLGGGSLRAREMDNSGMCDTMKTMLGEKTEPHPDSPTEMDMHEIGIRRIIQDLMIKLDAGELTQFDTEDVNSGEPYYAFNFLSENEIFESHKDLWLDSPLGIIVRFDTDEKKVETIEFSATFSNKLYGGEEMTFSRQYFLDMDLDYFVDRGYISIIDYFNFFKGLVKNFSTYVLT